MQVSSGKLTGIKVVLAVTMLLGLFWGVGNLLFTESMFEATAPAGEQFTSSVDVLSKLTAGFMLAWVVAAGLAFRNVLGNLGLLKAIIIALGIFAAVGFYIDLTVAERTAAIAWATDVLLLVLFVALLVLYPREVGRA
ncbi:MAG: hypothetical protein HYY01_15165 [Chloroflexi bacterium]|nr:hypothetical protein [Chloroflexota bacterium]